MAQAVFAALAHARFARENSLLAYGGPLGLTHATLESWIAAGLMHRGRVKLDPISGPEVSYLALTTSGARTMAYATGLAVQGITGATLNRSSQKRAHDVEVGEFALAVLSLGRDRTIDLLGIETDARRLATCTTVADLGRGHERVALKPDALVVARSESGLSGLLVEVDRGTIAAPRMADKYAAYVAWKQSGGCERQFSIKALRVLTIAPSESRLRQLRQAGLRATAGRRSGFLLFALAADVSAADAGRLMEPIAHRTGAESDSAIPLFESSAAGD